MKLNLQKRKCNRVAGVLIEAIIAATLLVTATTALTRYVVSSRQLSIAADQRLAAQLSCQNVIERLRAVSADDWQSQSELIAAAVFETSGIVTKIDVDSFQIDERDAVHATVRCQIGNSEDDFVDNHAWKVAP
jgi:Tfp pilus assembly protein PilV